MDKQIARVFPRRTEATPDDDLAFIGEPPQLFLRDMEIKEAHVSVAFTWDIPYAEYLARQWEMIGVPVKVGGPAYDEKGGEFVPGMYIKHGYTITSRGCPNNCPFCFVPKREGPLRELPIHPGHNVLDDNLLACSDRHIRAVFDMLQALPERPKFTGGFEAAQLVKKPWVVEHLRELRPKGMYFAYDMPGKYEALVEAGKLLRAGGFTAESHEVMCYVLAGYFPDDTPERAEKRLKDAWRAGYFPYAMIYRDELGQVPTGWEAFYRNWSRREAVATNLQGIEVMTL